MDDIMHKSGDDIAADGSEPNINPNYAVSTCEDRPQNIGYGAMSVDKCVEGFMATVNGCDERELNGEKFWKSGNGAAYLAFHTPANNLYSAADARASPPWQGAPSKFGSSTLRTTTPLHRSSSLFHEKLRSMYFLPIISLSVLTQGSFTFTPRALYEAGVHHNGLNETQALKYWPTSNLGYRIHTHRSVEVGSARNSEQESSDSQHGGTTANEKDESGNAASTEPAEDNEKNDDSDDSHIRDDAPCPNVIEEVFWCSECGGKDATGNCNGITDDENINLWKGCDCADDPDWSQSPRGRVNPNLRRDRNILGNLHLLPNNPTREDFDRLAERDVGSGRGEESGSVRAPLATFAALSGVHSV
ncbi:hypothetical protein BDV96DRAFT_638479 [Lophiotrema nucula]|uniref:Uncharacterized protein n=1 Tax=Lophiotrema nucula TaxID=690887 RepID=A0A6A5YFY6_9PLEO|nr:hypothetical protein BDV96DRAFT_638479 [Lophiotrema nucula]